MKKNQIFLVILSALAILSCNLERVEEGGPGTATRFKVVIGDMGEDRANDLILASGGGYVVAGNNNQGADYQAYLARLDAQGVLQWERLFGGAGIETAKAVAEAPDGGFVICGQIDNDIFLLKVNAAGNKVWEKTYGAVDSIEYGFGIVPTGTTGDFLVGYMSLISGFSSIGLMRINANGLRLSNSIVRSGNYYITRMIKTSDSKIAMVGSESVSGTATYVLKLNENGSFIWENRYPTSNPNFSPAYGIAEAAGGSLVAAGSDLGASDHDFQLVSYSAIGGFQYAVPWGGANADELIGIAKTSDNELAVVGYTSSFSGQTEIYLSKRKASDGSMIWEKNFEPISGLWNDIEACPDGGLILTAVQNTANADIIIVKTDAAGEYQ